MIKLFASDLDGTLLNPLHATDGIIRRAVREVVESGAHAVIATGRALHSAETLGFGKLPLEVVGSNGSIIRSSEGELLKAFTIPKGEVEELLRTFPQAAFECVAPEGSYLLASVEDWAATFAGDSLFDRLTLKRRIFKRVLHDGRTRFGQSLAQVLERDICKFNCRVPDAGLKREIFSYLAEHEDTLVNAPFKPVMFEISQAGVNKAVGVSWLASYLGISEDEVAVYGDGGNDIEMLQHFRHAFAPADASDAAKHAAATVIGRNIAYGVPRHMVRMVRAQQGRYVVE